MKKFIYISDGAAMHFKNKYKLINLKFHKIDFSLEAEQLLTATSQSKSACDGKIINSFVSTLFSIVRTIEYKMTGVPHYNP